MMSSGFVLDTSPLTRENIKPCFEYVQTEIGKVDSSFTMMDIKCSTSYQFAFQISSGSPENPYKLFLMKVDFKLQINHGQKITACIPLSSLNILSFTEHLLAIVNICLDKQYKITGLNGESMTSLSAQHNPWTAISKLTTLIEMHLQPNTP